MMPVSYAINTQLRAPKVDKTYQKIIAVDSFVRKNDLFIYCRIFWNLGFSKCYMVYFNSIDVKEVDKIFRTMILPQGEIYYKPADFV